MGKTIYITPGSPWENPYLESFIGKLRHECLNQYLFANLGECPCAVQHQAGAVGNVVVEPLKEPVPSL